MVAVLAARDLREQFISGSGVAQGSLIAAIALGVVLTYRGAGVVNFASGTVAMYAGYVYAGLRTDGDLFVPPLPNPLAPVEGVVHWFQPSDAFDLPDWPTAVSFGGAMGFWAALAVSLLFCVALGLVIHLLIFRPLRHAPQLAKVVASVGLLLLMQAIVIRRFATTPRTVKPLTFVSKQRVDLWVLEITREQLFVAVLVIAFTVALSALFRFTRFGLATRAAAENERGAVVLGFSPDRLAGINWVLATCITGLLGIFVASINSSVEPTAVPALILPALSAALVGGFRSFGWTTLTAFLLGMQVPLIQYIGVRRSWFPHSGNQPIPGVSQLVPLLVILAVLYLWGDALPSRGAVATGRLPAVPTPARWARRYGGPALAVLTAVAGLFWFTPAFRGALANSLVGVVVCLSLVVLTGFVGQISLAQMSFAGIAAFVVSKLSSEHGWPFPLPIFAGAAVALAARHGGGAAGAARARREPGHRHARLRGDGRRADLRQPVGERRAPAGAGERAQMARPQPGPATHAPRHHDRRRQDPQPADRDGVPRRRARAGVRRGEHPPLRNRSPDARRARRTSGPRRRRV